MYSKRSKQDPKETKLLDSRLLSWAIQRSDTTIARSVQYVPEINLAGLGLDDVDLLRSYKKLKDVNVSDNRLKHLRFVNYLNHLISLNASHNRVRELFSFPLSCETSLRFIDVSFNQLTAIPDLTALQFLSELNLERNKLNNLDSLKDCVRLRKLNVAENLIETLAPISRCPLFYLDASKNRILSLQGLKNSTKLEYLDVSNNEIDELKNIAETLVGLKTVNLANNRIKNESEIEVLKHLPVLKTLNVEGNPFLSEIPKNEKKVSAPPAQSPDSGVNSGNYTSGDELLKTSSYSNKLVILIGPNIGDKLDVADRLFHKYLQYISIVQMVTDESDKDCVNYYEEHNQDQDLIRDDIPASSCFYFIHIDQEKFNQLVQSQSFAFVYSRNDFHYGLLKSTLAECQKSNKIPVLLIELEGLPVLKSQNWESTDILLMCKTKESLEKKVLNRFSGNDKIVRQILGRFELYQLSLTKKKNQYSNVIKTDNSQEMFSKTDEILASLLSSDKSSRTAKYLPSRTDQEKPNKKLIHRKSSITIALHQEAAVKPFIPAKTNSVGLMETIEKSIIGRNDTFSGPFGERLIIYCDYTASGKSLSFIEDFISKNVLPKYSNTHTTNTATSLQTTSYRYEAREIVKNCCNASDDDVVLFVGSGTTGAIHKLVHNILLDPNSPIVIVGPFEHHSNLLPWRYYAIEVDRVGIDANGGMDIEELESLLKKRSQQSKSEMRRLICSFSAASNVTGILTDTERVSILVHSYGGLVFWDYASGAPYLAMNMNPKTEGPEKNLNYKDAIFFSMHKFVGGVQTPGVLIAKRFIFNRGEIYPHGAGGGTVFYVGREKHLFLKDIEEREEGGTPEIVGSIRAGLTLSLKDSVGEKAILDREEYLMNLAWTKFTKAPKSLVILGGKEMHRIPIISFVIQLQIPNTNKFIFLHHNFVCCLLNDLFGIQSRSGCACAGPYGMDLMGMDETMATRYMTCLMGCDAPNTGSVFHSEREIMKPGFTRVNLAYFAPDAEIQFILDAIIFVAQYGIHFLSSYAVDKHAGSWKHRDERTEDSIVISLNDISFENSNQLIKGKSHSVVNEMSCPDTFNDVMNRAVLKLEEVKNSNLTLDNDDTDMFDDNENQLRWFLVPSEAHVILYPKTENPNSVSSPFIPGSMAPAVEGDGKGKEILDSNVSEIISKYKPKPYCPKKKGLKDHYIEHGYNSIFDDRPQQSDKFIAEEVDEED